MAVDRVPTRKGVAVRLHEVGGDPMCEDLFQIADNREADWYVR
jgi:hypothetical protein